MLFRDTVLSFSLSYGIFFIFTRELFSEATSTNRRILRGKLHNRQKRDIEVLAECGTQCLPLDQIKDYEILVEYDMEESGNNHQVNSPEPNSPRISGSSCAYVCKMINKTGDLEPSLSTQASVPTLSSFPADKTLASVDKKTSFSTTPTSTEIEQSSSTTIETTSLNSSTVENATTDVNKIDSNFQVPNLSSDSNESNFRKLSPLTEFVSKHSNAQTSHTPKDKAQTHHKTISESLEDRFSVLDTELVRKEPKTKLSDTKQTQFSKNEVHTKIFAKIYDSISRISADFEVIKNLTEILMLTGKSNILSSVDPSVENNKEGFSEDTLQSQLLLPINTNGSQSNFGILCMKTSKENYYICEDIESTNSVFTSSTTPTVDIFDKTTSNLSLGTVASLEAPPTVGTTPSETGAVISTANSKNLLSSDSPNSSTAFSEMEREHSFSTAGSVDTIFLPKNITLTSESINTQNKVSPNIYTTPELDTMEITKDKNLGKVTEDLKASTANLWSSLGFITKSVKSVELTSTNPNSFPEDHTHVESFSPSTALITPTSDKTATSTNAFTDDHTTFESFSPSKAPMTSNTNTSSTTKTGFSEDHTDVQVFVPLKPLMSSNGDKTATATNAFTADHTTFESFSSSKPPMTSNTNTSSTTTNELLEDPINVDRFLPLMPQMTSNGGITSTSATAFPENHTKVQSFLPSKPVITSNSSTASTTTGTYAEDHIDFESLSPLKPLVKSKSDVTATSTTVFPENHTGVASFTPLKLLMLSNSDAVEMHYSNETTEETTGNNDNGTNFYTDHTVSLPHIFFSKVNKSTESINNGKEIYKISYPSTEDKIKKVLKINKSKMLSEESTGRTTKAAPTSSFTKDTDIETVDVTSNAPDVSSHNDESEIDYNSTDDSDDN